MSFRTPTVRKNRDPEWNSEWIVANVPASGFHLKCHVYDEDAADHDDKLGNAYVDVDSVNGQWPGIKEQSIRLKKRMGSKRVYLFGNIAALASRRLDVQSHIVISVQCLGKTPGDEGAHMYTIGPNYWFKHFSPLIGRIAGTKDKVQSQRDEKKTITRYKFVPRPALKFLKKMIRLQSLCSVFRQSKYSSRALCLPRSIIVMSNSSRL